jgi:glycosyltransferase involved in cell wall biosynthesis
MKLIFITVGEPLSQIESFIYTEITSIIQYNKNITIFPLISNKLSAGSELLQYMDKSSSRTKRKIVVRQIIAKNFRLLLCLFKLMLSQKPKRFLYSLYFLPKTLLLIDIIEQKNIEHIHAYWGTTPATCALIASKITGVPFSFSIHRADIDNSDILAIKARSASFVRCVSKKGYQDCLKSCPANKLKILHMGVHIPQNQKIRKKNKTTKIVIVARLIPIKRIPQLIMATSKLKNAKLYIIGEGPLRKKIQTIIKKLNLDKQVHLLGYLSQEQIFSLYKKRDFDLFVLPSANEGIPVSAMEAMAYSIPVALTKVGGTSELVSDRNGYFLTYDLSNLASIALSIPEKEKIYNARAKILRDFNSRKNAKELLKFFLK